LKISINDILIITRDNNDRGQKLSYTIKGGTKTLTGDMEGAMTQQRVYINVAKEFKGMDISKLNVLVKDQNGKTIYEGDIPLVKVDNLIK
jgi:pyruvate dehydrogenase complex dehydrogenase (E1) component